MKIRWAELGKWTILCLTPSLITVIGKVPFHASLILTFSHVLGLVTAGLCILSLLNLQKTRSPADTIVLSYGAGWSTIPFFALASWISGHHITVILLIISVFFIGIRWWLQRIQKKGFSNNHSGQKHPVIPFTLYLASLIYTLVSVALPFSYFSFNSIAREFYIDGIQRFGTIYALSQDIPPNNPFFSGARLMYYWFSFFPFAIEYRFIHHDLFNVWKSGQLWTSLLFMPFLWFVMAKVFREKVVAWSVILFSFFFASYEIFANLYWAKPILTQWHGLGNVIKLLKSLALSHDPDMVVGIVTQYSDQLFMEDFLYIPHNAYALLVIVSGLWFMKEKKHWAMIFSFSSLAAINTFFIIPVFSSLLVHFFIGYRLIAACVSSLLLCSYALLWMIMCRIVLYPSFLLGLLTAFAATAIFTYCSRQNCFSTFNGKSTFSNILRISTWSFLISLLLLLLLRPKYNFVVLVLNYGPSFLIGLFFLCHMLFAKTYPETGKDGLTLIFLFVSGTIFNLVTVLVYLQFLDYVPLPLKDLSYRIGLDINLFNFYHKIGKLARLSWAIFAGLGIALLGSVFLNHLLKRKLQLLLLLLALFAATLTSFVRPLTYLTSGPVDEAGAGQYLVQEKKDISTTLLVEDYNGSRINLLAPVSVFYYSSWTGGNPGLTHAIGTWADQYLIKSARNESKRREIINRHFFSNATDNHERQLILKEYRIDYILTRKKYDFYPFADLVVNKEGGFLYKARNIWKQKNSESLPINNTSYRFGVIYPFRMPDGDLLRSCKNSVCCLNALHK